MNDALDKMTSYLDSLYGAPGVLLVLVTCNALGYFLKMSSWCDNKNIPKWVVLWGILSNVMFRSLPVVPANTTATVSVWLFVQHFGRLIAIGFLIGVVSSVLYDKVLSRLEEQWPWLAKFLTPVDNGELTTRTSELIVRTSETTDKPAAVPATPPAESKPGP